MALRQLQAEELLHHRGEVDLVVAREAAGEFGVVERRRSHADLGQAGQVLVGRVQHPLVGGQHLRDRSQRGDRITAVVDGVDEHRARTGPPDLDQVGAIRIAEARRAFGVDRERSVAGRQEFGSSLRYRLC